jgi:ribosomal-protein-alanine N-acetyltransferase
MLFETKRLQCRQLSSDDIHSLFDVYSDVDAMKWVGDGSPLSLKQCADWIEITERNYSKYGYGLFALDLIASGKTIGFCGIIHPDAQLEPEIKYALLRQYWGIGLATEAVQALLSYAVQQYGLKFFIATVAPENTISQHVLVKSGMTYAHERTDKDGFIDKVYEYHASKA